jgi:hypothetical protein
MRFWPFPMPVETRAGETVMIHGAHDRHNVRVWMET